MEEQKIIKSKIIKSAAFYIKSPLEYHIYSYPFLPAYLLWLYVYLYKYEEVFSYPELSTFSFLVVLSIHSLLFLSCHWNVNVKAFVTCKKETDPFKATFIKVIPIQHAGSGELVPLEKGEFKDSSKQKKHTLFFMYQKTKFIYNDSLKMFEELDFPITGFTMEFFKQSAGFLDESDIKHSVLKYGPNKFDIPIPRFLDLMKEQATAPFFIFQLFCVSLWFLDDMWYYSLFTVFMLVVFESTVAFQRLKTLQEFRSMGIKPTSIYVFRLKKWIQIQTDELLPGDVCSILRSDEEEGAPPVPCDMLILQGSCIANEAMLSGESTPQMKESVWLRDNGEVFDIENDKGSVLFGGTRVLQVTPPKYGAVMSKCDAKGGDDESDGSNSPIHSFNPRIPNPAPDSGCIGVVLRTGFSTQQGKLVRMMIYSTERVTANNIESLLFIVFLLFFAVIAAAYVWQEGMSNPDRKRSKVLLDCVLIVTSVVPPELPMELSLAVNNSLIALSKCYVFCTEPFRIPFAGKIDIACFDKTGTLTVEDLIVEGVVGEPTNHNSASAVNEALINAQHASKETMYVLASAHALVYLDENIAKKDEKSSKKASNVIGDPMEKNTLDAIHWTVRKGDIISPSPDLPKLTNATIHPKTEIKIVRRYQFSSSLKRMSTLCQITENGKSSSNLFVSVKGAPETLESMFVNVPSNYEALYKYWARRGSRVLSLGWKYLKDNKILVHDLNRFDHVECKLNFGGFLVFHCPLKPDSVESIRMLNHSSHRVTMITGDNALTAAHVAKQVEIVKRPVLIADVWNEDSGLEWRTVDEEITIKMDSKVSPEHLGSQLSPYDLCITGNALEGILDLYYYNQETKISHKQRTTDTKKIDFFMNFLLPRIWVYARVSPVQKEFILTTLKEAGFTTLMCGDGTNDVGALKQAHVGVALLDGNAEDIEKLAKRTMIKRRKELIEKQKQLRERWTPKPPAAASFDTSGAIGSLAKTVSETERKRKEKEDEMKNKLDEMLADMGDEPPMLKFGDASVAAPFTSKISSIKSVVNIVRQGRSTLVAMIQMYKILALNCLVTAYSMSVMYLAGIKQGDWQATIAGFMLTACFFGIAKSSPVEKLSKKRPLTNIFNFYIILSVMGQAAVHVASLTYIRIEAIQYSEELDEQIDLDAEFQPNILNSAVYLVTLIMQISTFAINYQGLPFRESLRENKPLFRSLAIVAAIAVIAASESFSELNEWMQLVPFPDDFRGKLMWTMAFDFGCAFVIETVTSYLFSDNKPKKSLLLDMVLLPEKSVILETSAGSVTIELYWKHAPKSCQNFYQLAKRGYYNNTKFHRIIADFMIQGGDPTATGKGGSSIYGDKFEDEIHPDLQHSGAGILSMANSGPNTNGSQFFITLAPTPWLDKKHSIFGRIFSGMTVVKRIGLVPTDAGDRPTEDVLIYRASVTD